MAEINMTAPTVAQIDKLLRAVQSKAVAVGKENVRRATEYGTGYAKDQLRGYLGRESDVIEGIRGEFNSVTGEGKILATHEASPYVEYGTGTIGQWNPHPAGPAPEGYRVGGWTFEHAPYGMGRFWTHGQVSKPFMYDTYMHLRDRFWK